MDGLSSMRCSRACHACDHCVLPYLVSGSQQTLCRDEVSGKVAAVDPAEPAAIQKALEEKCDSGALWVHVSVLIFFFQFRGVIRRMGSRPRFFLKSVHRVGIISLSGLKQTQVKFFLHHVCTTFCCVCLPTLPKPFGTRLCQC